MNADRLLAHYEKIADTPDAIPRLRRFILDLAVRGKLVSQDPNDEPASELLKRIAAEKARLVKSGEIRGKRGESPDLSEPPFELPGNWTWIAFGYVHQLIRGVTYSKSDVSEVPSAGFVPVLRANNIGTTLNHEEPVYVKENCVSADQFLKSGDFMIALSSGSKNLVGKAAFVPDDYREAFGGFCGVIRLFDQSLQGIVRIYLQSNLYRESIAAGSRGIGINNLKKETVSNLFFPLPPLAEQSRIVAKVDELMALCDRLEAERTKREAARDRLAAASLARLNAPDPETFQADARFAINALPAITTRPDQIKALRQTILNLAVRGKLVPQDPNDEPASELHARLSKRFADRPLEKRRGRRSDLAAGLTGQPPYPAPPRWHWVRMSELGETNIGLTYSPNELGRYGTPVLRSNNVRGGRIVLDDLIRVASEPKSSVMVNQGDMLICARNGSRALVGKAAIIDKLPEPMAFGAFMAIFRSPINPYLHLFLTSPVFRQVIDEVNTNTINQITQENLKSTLVPLPPLAEQHRIVAKVNELMALCDQLEASLANADDTRQRLLEALLAEAFAPANDRSLGAAE